MNRAIQIGGLVVLLATAAICDQNKAAKTPPRPALKGAGGPRAGGGAKIPPPPRLVNPANPVVRLYQATPEQRERVLEKLPPDRQEAMRKHLADYDRLPKEQQQMRLQQAERFDALPIEKRRAIQRQLKALNELPKDRTQAVRQALRRLQIAPEEERARILNSEQFKRRFSSEEQKIILDLSEVFQPLM